MSSKILTLARLKKTLTKRRGQTIVFTNGCFDILHIGHIRYLKAAKKHGDILIIGLNSDGSVKRLKGPRRPITPERERAEVLAALECVDYIVIFEQPTPERLISSIQPDVLVKGGDWPLDKIAGADIVRAKKGLVLTVPFVKNKSTSRLIQKILRLG